MKAGKKAIKTRLRGCSHPNLITATANMSRAINQGLPSLYQRNLSAVQNLTSLPVPTRAANRFQDQAGDVRITQMAKSSSSRTQNTWLLDRVYIILKVGNCVSLDFGRQRPGEMSRREEGEVLAPQTAFSLLRCF